MAEEESVKVEVSHRRREYGVAIVQAMARVGAKLPTLDDPALVEATCRRLTQVPEESRDAWLRANPKAANLQTCRFLTEQTAALRESDPRLMLTTAHAAVACAEALSNHRWPMALTADARAEAWSGLANAYKVNNDFRQAEEAWRNAQLHLTFGTGDPLVKARFLTLKAALRIEQRRSRQAIEMLEEARQLYLSVQDAHQEGRTLLWLAKAYHQADRIEDAIASAFLGAQRISSERDKLAKLVAFHSLASYLDDAGRADLALGLLERCAPLYEEAGGPLLKLRKRWLEARLQSSVGRTDEAAQGLESVRLRFAELGLPFDAALAALELAVLYARQGKLVQVEALANEMYPVFVSREIPREASAALLLFAEAARSRTATAASVSMVVDRLKNIQTRKV